MHISFHTLWANNTHKIFEIVNTITLGCKDTKQIHLVTGKLISVHFQITHGRSVSIPCTTTEVWNILSHCQQYIYIYSLLKITLQNSISYITNSFICFAIRINQFDHSQQFPQYYHFP